MVRERRKALELGCPSGGRREGLSPQAALALQQATFFGRASLTLGCTIGDKDLYIAPAPHGAFRRCFLAAETTWYQTVSVHDPLPYG